MLVNFNLFKSAVNNTKKYNYISFEQKRTLKYNFYQSFDEFIKSVKTAQISSVSNKQPKTEMEIIFDETYQKLLEQNPITKELNITKPTLT